MRAETRALAIGTLVLGGLAAFVATRLELQTDITHFLPEGKSDEDVLLARELALGDLSRTMVLLVDGPTATEARDAGLRLEELLRADERVGPELAFLDGGPPEGVEEALWELYLPRRLSFFAEDAAGVAAATTDEALAGAAARLKDRLATPLSGLVGRVAPEDPTLILPALFERLGGGEGLAIQDGRFLTDDGSAAVLFLGTRAPSTDASVQRPLLAAIDEAFAQVDQEAGGTLRLTASAPHRFAVRAEDALRADVTRVSIGSVVGLTLLFLCLFGSLRVLLLILPVAGAGFLAGTAACLALFGSVHGLTLAFGSAMIGVSVDFALHFHGHHVLAPSPAGPRATLASIWNGLALSAATTAVGFLALCISSFPGLRELAVFGAAGITAALLATAAFLPALAVDRPPTPIASWVFRRLNGAFDRAPRPLLALPALVALVVTAVGLPRARWNDSPRDLNKLDAAQVAEDEEVRGRVVRYEQSRLVVALADDEEAALRHNDAVARILRRAQEDGLLRGQRSLAPLLPSAERQREVAAAVRAQPDLWPRLASALTDEGFRSEGFEPFRATLAGEPPAPLVYEDLMESELASLARPFRVAVGDRVAFLSFLDEVRDEAALRAELTSVDGARLLDVEGVLTDAYARYRERMSTLLGLGLGAVLVLVALRHRRLRPTIAAYVPAVLAGGSTIATLALCGVELNMLSLVALLLVVGLGVDYGVLLAETSNDPRAHAATRFAVLVAACSTVLGFGLLAFSDQPPLFSIGATAGIGVLASLVLAPSTSALLRSDPRS